MSVADQQEIPCAAQGRWADILMVLCCLFAIALQIRWLDEPWDASHAGFNSGTFCAYSCRGFERHGYFNVGGIPSDIHHAGDGDYYLRYVNHPPALYWLLYPCYLAFGKGEASIHLAMLLVLCFLLVTNRILLAALVGRTTAALSTALLASLPIIVQHARMADPIVFCLPFLVPCAVLWFRYLDRGSRGALWAYGLAAFAAGMMDWHVYFVVVALWLDLLFRKERSWRRWFLIGLPFGLALIVNLAWLGLTSPDLVKEVEDTWSMTSDAVAGGTRTYGHTLVPDPAEKINLWFARVGSHFDELITMPFIVLALSGFLSLAVGIRRRTTAFRLTLVLVVAGLIPFAAAHEHAFVHEFWPIMLAPAFSLLGALFIAAIAGTSAGSNGRLGAATIVLVAASAWGFHTGITYHAAARQTHPRNVVLDMNKRFDRNDLVLTASAQSSQNFYADFTIVRNVHHPDLFDRAMRRFYDKRHQFRKLWLFWPKSSKEDYHWLESGDYAVNYAFNEVYDGVEAAVVELDLEKSFARIKKKQ